MLQIEMAANGCVSGTLEEWPALDAELRARDIALPLSTNGIALKYVCRCVVAEATERAAVVAYLRAEAADFTRLGKERNSAPLENIGRALTDRADRIERGEHRSGEGGGDGSP